MMIALASLSLQWSSAASGTVTPQALGTLKSEASGISASGTSLHLAAAQKAEADRRPIGALPERNPLRRPNVSLSAVRAPGGETLTEGLSWRVERIIAAADDEEQRELVWSGGGAQPELKLEPGQYWAEVSYGLASNRVEFAVREGDPQERILSVDAGTLHIHAVAHPGGPKLTDMFFVLKRAESEAEAEAIGRSTLSSAVFHVPAGQYRLIARHGLDSVEVPVSIAAGEDKTVEAVTGTGEIVLSAHANDDDPPLSGATFYVYQQGETGQGKEILRSNLGEPKFRLPAGNYRIVAEIGLARAEQEIRITAGEQKRHHLVLNAGGARLISSLGDDRGPLRQHLLYRIYDLSAEAGAANKEVFTSTQPTPTIFLPSGRYRIESQYGWHNARQSREVRISAGEVQTVEFEHMAGGVRLRLASKDNGQAMDRVQWTLKYNGGGTVLISRDAEPSLILQAGRYQVMARRETRTYTETFEALPNKEQLVEIVAN